MIKIKNLINNDEIFYWFMTYNNYRLLKNDGISKFNLSSVAKPSLE